MNKLCVTTKCRYCEAMFVNGELRYRCTAQPYAPWVYPNISACPHEIPHREREKNMELEPMTPDELLEELQVYKKALELACSADGMFWESEYNDYLKKARSEG